MEDQVLTNSYYNEYPGPGPPQHDSHVLTGLGNLKLLSRSSSKPHLARSSTAIKFHKSILFSYFLSTIKNIKSRMICFCSGCICSSSAAAAVTVADYSGHTSLNPSAISSRSQSCYCNNENSFSSPQEDLSFPEFEINSF